MNGLTALEEIHRDFITNEVRVGSIETEDMLGKNFVFHDIDGNKFEVWSELSTRFKTKYDV